MRVHIIDTSVLVNILDIPGMNQDRVKVLEEYKVLIHDISKNLLILPLATIIETGNHIANISNGDIRWDRAQKMKKMLIDTVNDVAPWRYYGRDFEKDDLVKLASDFASNISSEIGMGDTSIIRVYERCKEEIPALGYIRIWATDEHLTGYSEELMMPVKRKKF